MKGRRPAGWMEIALISLVLVSAVTLSLLAEPKTYLGVTFPHGDLAFADRVVDYVAASCVRNAYDDPEEALGPPDAFTSGCSGCHGCNGCDTHAVALGFRLSQIDDRGFLVIEFVDNVLLDVPGDDLFIFITNGKPCYVEISINGFTWIPVGETFGCPAGIDIGPYVNEGEEFRFVRMTDVPADEDHSDCPGASIDAIGAMGTGEEEVFFGEASGGLAIQPVGQLLFSFGQRAADAILILLDTTSSMGDTIDGRPKIEIAKDAVIGLLDRIPAGTTVGLRTFASCGQSKLLSPLDDPVGVSALKAAVRLLGPGGSTPLAFAIEQAEEDCSSIPGAKTVVIVSDGMETCKGNPIQAAKGLAASASQLTAYTIGFDVGGNLAARDQLVEIARVLDGEYLDARDADELSLALSLAAPLSYTVTDASGNVVYTGYLGDTGPGELPAGTYTVVIDAAPPIELEDVVISGDGTTRIVIGSVGGRLSAEVFED